jgi:hypothetical protein
LSESERGYFTVFRNEERTMATDTTPPPRSNDPANDGYEIRIADEARRDAGHDVDDEVREAGRDVDDKSRTVRERISDAIEDVIPGDSDKDGH